MTEPCRKRDSNTAKADVADAVHAAEVYLVGDPAFAGDPARVTAAMVRNRTGGHVAFDPDRHRRLTQLALGRLSPDCRELLRLSFVEQEPLSLLRARLGARTERSVLYRRAICLRRVKAYLVERLQGLDAGLTCLDPQLGGAVWQLEVPDTASDLCRRLEHHLAACDSCRQQQRVTATVVAGLRDGSLHLGPMHRSHARVFRAVAISGAVTLALGLGLMVWHSADDTTARLIGGVGAAALLVGGWFGRRRTDLESAFDDMAEG